MKKLSSVLVVGALALAACAGTAVADEPLGDDSVGSAMGPGISIGEALDLDSDQPVLVNGFIYVDEDGSVSLVSMFAESLPPIPGGDQITVLGIDLSNYELTEAQGLKWTDQSVQILGVLDGSTLTVDQTLSA